MAYGLPIYLFYELVKLFYPHINTASSTKISLDMIDAIGIIKFCQPTYFHSDYIQLFDQGYQSEIGIEVYFVFMDLAFRCTDLMHAMQNAPYIHDGINQTL